MKELDVELNCKTYTTLMHAAARWYGSETQILHLYREMKQNHVQIDCLCFTILPAATPVS